MLIFSLSGQVRSLTWPDVISKPLHGHKMPQLRNAVKDRRSFSGGWNFQKVTNPRELTFCISRMFHAGHLRSGQSRDLAHYKPMQGIPKLLIWQHKWYNPNSDKANIEWPNLCVPKYQNQNQPKYNFKRLSVSNQSQGRCKCRKHHENAKMRTSKLAKIEDTCAWHKSPQVIQVIS